MSFRFSLLALLLLICAYSHAERYSVEEDRFGNLDAKKLESAPRDSSESDPDTQADEPDNERKVVDTEAEVATVISQSPPPESDTSHEPLELDPSAQNVREGDSVERERVIVSGAEAQASEGEGEAAGAVQAIGETETLSVFERRFVESEGGDPAVLYQRARVSDYDATEVDEAEFVDGDALLEGKVQQGRQPYFVTLDADGQRSVTFYSPELIKQALLDKKDTFSFTDVTIFSASEAEEGVVEADPVALSILLGGEGAQELGYFETFSKQCCTQLPHQKIPELEPGRARFFSLTKQELPYRFMEGDSRYLLLKLPKQNQNFPLRLRSFIRNHSELGIAHGAFFPTLVTLDKQKQPLRIITDPLMHYEPENWVKYGYLEMMIEIEQRADEPRDERFLLINTTRDDIRKVTLTEAEPEEEQPAIEIQHMATGSFEIQVMLEEQL